MQVATTLLGLMIAIATASTSDTTTPPTLLELPICELHNVQAGQQMHFTSPEQMIEIRVIFLRFAAMNCSVVNFCNITWFKDAPAGNTCDAAQFKDVLPLKLGYRMELQRYNQTLEIQRASRDRKGNYTCVATDGKATICRTFQLHILDEPWEKPPQPLLADTCTNQTASVGTSVEFFCYFFAGDESKDVQTRWYKRTGSSSWIPVSDLNPQEEQYEEETHYSERADFSDSGLKPTAGKHLYIRHVTEEAYGDYRLQANNSYGVKYTDPLSLSAPPPEPKADLRLIVTASVVVMCLLLLVVVMAVIWHFKKLDIKIWKKNHFGALEDDDGKTYDAFISYAEEDLPFAMKVREMLEQAGYTVCVGDIDFTPATTLVEEIILSLHTSRRCLIVISPDFIHARHSNLQVDVAAEQMMQNQIKIVPVLYRRVSSEDREAMPLLKRILSNVRVVKWEENGADKFTKRLLIHMPPHRPAAAALPNEIEGRNLLHGSLTPDGSINAAVGATPANNRGAVGTEMDRFLRDVGEAGARSHHHANKGQTDNALLC